MKPLTPLKNNYEGSTKVCDYPLVVYYDNFLTPAECDHFIKIAGPKMERAKVSLDNEGGYSDGRTGSSCHFPHAHDMITYGASNRIAKVVGLPLEHCEQIQAIHYGATQEYRPHFDAFNLKNPRGQRTAKLGGQRLVTTLVYLNDVIDGGGTAFPKIGEEVQAKKGRLVIFHNCTEGTMEIHPFSLHAGSPVNIGHKWAFNLWFRNRPRNELQEPFPE